MDDLQAGCASAKPDPRRQEVTNHGSAVLTAIDALNHGRFLDAQLHIGKIPMCGEVAAHIGDLAAMADAGRGDIGLAGIASRFSGGAMICWSRDGDPQTRDRAAKRLIHFEGLQPVRQTDDGLVMRAGGGERCQLRFDFSNDIGASVFVHYLIRTEFEGSEVFAAIRWLHGAEDEEVVVRFRPSHVVAGHRIEVDFPQSPIFNHVTVARHQGMDLVFLNGLPIYRARATTSFPTGATIDLIGTEGNLSRIHIPLFIVTGHDSYPFLRQVDASEWFTMLVTAYAERGDLDGLSRAVHAFADADAGLTADAFELALEANLRRRQGYRDYLTDLLVGKLPDGARGEALDRLSAKEPPAVVLVENATVHMSSNPSLHASLGRVLGRHPPMATLLHQINFRAYPGDIVGIVGKNGAGKSTLLKTLVSSMPLSEGRISIDGRPVLLRPGAGMQGDLTGRENLLKTGLYMGFLPHELEELMGDIIEFSELAEHIDRPFKYYSDGMRARLVFALATAIPREILLLDELLSAGDMGFQRKAMKRLDEFISRAKVVFVVQHTFDFVLSRCTKCLLLERGYPTYFGDPKIAIELYKESL